MVYNWLKFKDNRKSFLHNSRPGQDDSNDIFIGNILVFEFLILKNKNFFFIPN